MDLSKDCSACNKSLLLKLIVFWSEHVVLASSIIFLSFSRYNNFCWLFIDCKGVPAPPPLCKAPTLWPSLPPPFSKFLYPLPYFLFHLLWKYFRQFPHPHTNPSCTNPTNQPTFLGLNKYQKGEFTSSTVAFYQKSIFIFQICIQIGYLNLWDIFWFIFRQLRMTFFIKLWWQKKNVFLQMHNSILQRVK